MKTHKLSRLCIVLWLFGKLWLCEGQPDYCNGTQTLTAGSGEIESHNAAGLTDYKNNTKCVWIITAPAGKQVSVWFNYFSLYSDYDHVRIRDGVINLYISYLSHQYKPTPRSYESTSNVMRVEFDTDSGGTSLGFKMQYTATDNYCRGFKNLTGTLKEEEIMGHVRVASLSSTDSISCYWQINAPHGHRIFAWFKFIDLENDLDTVTFFDGANGSTVIAAVNSYASTTNLSPRYLSTSNILTVHFLFRSRNPLQFGFRLGYQAVNATPNNTCGSIELSKSSNTSGLIGGHGSHGSTEYSPNMACSWTLPQLLGHYILLTVDFLALGKGDCVAISSSASSNGSGNTTYCGWRAEWVMSLVMHGDVSIAFSSDSRYESVGFRIKFRYEQLCYGSHYLTAESGEIKSHREASIADYENNTSCHWIVIVPPGKFLLAWFTHFSLHAYADADNVTLHSVRFGDGVITFAPYTSFSGSSDSPTGSYIFYSKSNNLRVDFKTDGSGTSTGFKLQYNTTEDYCDGFKNISTLDGEIVSHLKVGLQSYLSGMRCHWQLNVPHGYRISAWFTYMDLVSRADRVSLYDGARGSSIIAAVSISNMNQSAPSPSKYMSTSNALSVYFYTTHRDHNRLGFRLRYRAINASTVVTRTTTTTTSTNEVKAASRLSCAHSSLIVAAASFWALLRRTTDNQFY